MIEEFKDVLIKFFEAEEKNLNRDDILVLRYEEIKQYAFGILETSFFNQERYEIIYDGTKDEFTLNVYQIIKNCRVIRNEERVS